MTEYVEGFKAGQRVEIIHVVGVGSVPPNIVGKTGVVAELNDAILASIQPGEVPVRIALVLATRLRDEETAVYLLAPAFLKHVEGEPNVYQVPGVGSR